MLTQSEIDAIKQEAEKYATFEGNIDYDLVNAYFAGATEERQRAKVLQTAVETLLSAIEFVATEHSANYVIETPDTEMLKAALNTYNKNKPI